MIKLDDSWLSYLEWEFEKPYFVEIKDFLKSEIEAWKTLYPHPKNIFNALNLTKFDEVKVVILGQDPYHWEWQAHGLSFSVPDWVRKPPSLQNIFKEIKTDLWKDISESWNLERWAKEWVLLLNAILTVEKSKAASHSKIWWQNFTDEVIRTISKEKDGVVFLLWGNFARQKKVLIDATKHCILEAPHPSPFSAYSWFFGCKHFSKANDFLKERGDKEIEW